MKVMQKFILCLMLVFATLALAGTDARAKTISGGCGDHVTYGFNSDTGVLSIGGTGPMKNYTSSASLLSSIPAANISISSVSSIVIEDGVTSIGDYAFQMCYRVSKVTLGKDVTSIGKGAFSGCYNLQGITIDKNVTSIGENAFENCAKNLPDQTIEISGYKGTVAESYATANGHKFVALDTPQATKKPTATKKPAATKKPTATKKPSTRSKEVIKGKAPK
ncbi:MAG: leucine-rich repeat domain-containing protein, partial [Lachnospiraceae bacterium]|nr:leucine-rich repeat domain-containing protein [Lachnospiraceae bacterium]